VGTVSDTGNLSGLDVDEFSQDMVKPEPISLLPKASILKGRSFNGGTVFAKL
jgi:hypothetical protein